MKIKAENLFRELVRRANISRKVCLRDLSFTAQNLAIDDDSRLKAYNCTRRAGKTLGVVIDFLESGSNNPNTKYLYMALTIDSARGICWDDLKEYNEKHSLGFKPNEARSELRHPNGSLIKLAGADCSEKQMRKILGQKYKKVAIDEAGSFTINMTRLVYQMIEPTLIDQMGVLILLGTCENIPNTFFEKVTEGKEQGWSVHKWTAADNPHVRDNFLKQIDSILSRNPLAKEASWFKTHYLNQWCTDDELLIINVSDYNICKGLPPIVKGSRWFYVLGVDIGYNDANAFTITAFNKYQRKVYFIKSFKEANLDFTGVSKIIKKLQTDYPFFRIVIDGANKQGVMELRNRWGLPLQSAEKTGKATYLRLLKDDFIEGLGMIIEGECNELETEWSQLIWVDENKEKEDPRCQNHCCFPKGEMVLTSKGWKEIQKIKIGEMVLTLKGYKRVVSTMVREYSGKMYSSEFSNGTIVESTANHPFYTNNGLTRADCLTKEMRFCTLGEWKKKQLNSWAKSTAFMLLLNIGAFVITISVAVRVLSIFTGQSGSITGEGYLIIMSFITLMVILLITGFLILKSLKKATIQVCTQEEKKEKRCQEGQSKLLLSQRLHGTRARMGTIGIKNMVRMSLGEVLSLEKRILLEFAIYAEKILGLISSPKRQEFAHKIVTRKKEEYQESIISKKNVIGVARNTSQTNTVNLSFAADLVHQSMETVSGRKVYNLTVEDQHQYFTNGILVSNSDSALYSWREAKHYVAKDPPENPSINSQRYMDLMEEREAREMEKRLKEERETEEWI